MSMSQRLRMNVNQTGCTTTPRELSSLSSNSLARMQTHWMWRGRWVNGLKVSTSRHHILGFMTEIALRRREKILASYPRIKVPCIRAYTAVAARAANPLASTFWASACFHLLLISKLICRCIRTFSYWFALFGLKSQSLSVNGLRISLRMII